MEQLQVDLNPANLNALSDFDLGVWATPEGTTFVDGQLFFFSSSDLMRLRPLF